MEDKNQVNSLQGESYQNSPVSDIHEPPPTAQAFSLEPLDQPQLISQEPSPVKARWFVRIARRKDVLIAVVLLFIAAGITYRVLYHQGAPSASTSASSRFAAVAIPLAPLISGKDLELSGSANVTINGSFQLNNGLQLAPTLQPTGAKPGQIYYDQGTNQLAYYNGSEFVFLTSPGNTAGGVQSLGGATGQLTLGGGLTLASGQLANSGVLSVQGQNGDVTFTAGAGIILNGTTFSNGGIIGITAGSPNVTVANDGNGNVTISVAQPIAGTGTLTSSGGTAGIIPMYTSAQNIENSIIAQSGLTVTISGDLSVVTGGLSLSNALTVSNGGTGATSFASNGLLVGQGTGAVTSVAAGGSGLCLLSTAGLPAWGACPGAAGVSTLNGLNGALSIANASAAGSTITIDDASTSSKGIATFSATNFSVSGGVVTTIQNINTGATPTFAGLNTNSITPSSGLTVGATAQTLTLQGSATTTLTATNGANTTSLAFGSPTANVTYRLQTASAGTYDICTTASNCAISGGVTTPGGTTNHLAKFSGSQIIGDSIVVDNGTTVSVAGALSVQTDSTFTGNIAVNGGNITATGALNITPGGTLTVGVAGQQLILQGNASTQLTATSGGNTTTLNFQTPTANVTYRVPTATAGTYDFCTTAGNCVGSGGGVTTSGGSTNRLAKFSGSQVIGDSSITDDGTTVTTSTDLVIQGGDVTIGVANAQTGSINFARNDSAFIGTLMQGSLTGNRSYVLPDADGTICLSSGNCSGAGSSNTLQAAYDAGNSITTTSAKDIAFTLADTATDSNFTVTTAANSTGYVAITRANGAASADPAQLLLINNANTARAQPVGLKVQSAAGGITTAIDLTDSNIGTAINIGIHNIVGTSATISLTNVSLAGATGNITTSGTINGQTISSTASLTGTLAVAGTATFTSNIAVNGGSITSTGALNITPSGTLTVGATGQQLVLQGSASTQLTATGGGFTTTVGFTGTPTANVTYNFDRSASTGTYTICTSIGNCAGSGGGVTSAGGTTGTIPVFTGSQAIGDSLLSQSGSTVTVNGNLNLLSGNQFQVNGTQISSAALSNDANLAKLNVSQTFTGGTNGFKNASNSTNAFNIQNAAGTRLLTADTTNGQVVLGTASSLSGTLVFANVSNANTVTILPGSPTANRTLTLPDASGIICTDSGNCAGAGATLQTAYNFSVGGTTPKIKVNSSLGGVDIQDADTPIGANLLNIRASNGAGLGSVLFGVGNTGQVTLQNSANSTTAFRLLTQGGTAVLTGDTTNGQLIVGQSSTLTGTFIFKNASNANTITLTSAAATANQTVTLPNATGTICLSSGNCSGAGSSNTLQAAYDAGNTVTTSSGRDVSFTLADTATDSNFLVNLQCVTSCGSNGRFAVQNAGTDVFSVAPNGGAATFQNSTNATTAFQVKNAAGSTTALDVDTTNGRVGVGNAAPGYALDVTGDVNSSTQYRIGGTVICTISGCTPAAGSGNYIQNTTSPQSANIAIQSAADGNISLLIKERATQSADLVRITDSSNTSLFNIDAFGAAHFSGGKVTIDSQAAIGDAASSGQQLRVTAASASVIGLTVSATNSGQTADVAEFFGPSSRSLIYNANGTLAVKGAAAQSNDLTEFQDSSGNVLSAFGATGQLTLGRITASGTTRAGSIALADGTTDNFGVTITATTLTASRSILLPNEAGTICLQASTNCSFAATSGSANYIQNQSVSSQTASFSINGTGRADTALQTSLLDTPTAATLAIGTTNATAINLNQNTTVASNKSFTAQGTALFKDATNAATAFQIQDSSSNVMLAVDTTNTIVQIGSSTTDTTGVLLVLDSYSNAGDPTGVAGAMYYNTTLGRFRCYMSGLWQNCVGGLIGSSTSQVTAVSCTTGCGAIATMNNVWAANYCTSGRTYHIYLSGIYSGSGSSPTLAFNIYIGATQLTGASTNAVTIPAGVTNLGWDADIYMVCNSPTSVYMHANFNLLTAASNGASMQSKIATGFATTVSNTQQSMFVYPVWSASSASNTITCMQFIVDSE